MSVASISAYYVNLLIAQYWDKPNAKATINALLTQLLANDVPLSVLNGYDVETAVGAQLDIIGKYLGVTRYFTGQFFTGYFAFVTYDEIGGSISSAKRGFSSYADMSKSGLWVQYKDIVSTTYTLNDFDYRIIIKMRIFQNNNNNSHKSIDDFIWILFGAENRIDADGDVRIDAGGNVRITAESISAAGVTVAPGGTMQIDYTANEFWTPLIQVAIEKEVLPKPLGVQLVF